MELTRFFQEVLDYNHFCNRKIIEVLTENRTRIAENPVKLASHIVNAHRIWNLRLENDPSPVSVWEIHPVDSLKEMDRENHVKTTGILKALPLDQIVTYTSSQGKKYANAVRDILFQITNHSTHHRAQILAELRKAGIEPPVLDYIFYKR